MRRPDALVVVDVQQGFAEVDHWGGGRNNPDAEANIARLLAAFRETGVPIVHVRHASTEPDSPLRPERPGHAPLPEAAELEGEPVVTKQVNGAFVGTDLDRLLTEAGARRVAVVGVQTDHCVSTTVRMGSDLGWEMVLVDDAAWCYDRRHPDGSLIPAGELHRANVASLSGEFAEVATTDQVIAALHDG